MGLKRPGAKVERVLSREARSSDDDRVVNERLRAAEPATVLHEFTAA